MDIFIELEKLRRGHYSCDDCWYSCPKSDEGCCSHFTHTECDCGAEESNEVLDEIIAYLKCQ